MIFLVVDGRVVAVGPDWMEHHFVEDVAVRFPGKSFFIEREVKE